MESWKERLLDELIDLIIDWESCNWMVEYLLDHEYTEEQLLELNFDEIDIQTVKEEMVAEREEE